MLLFSIYNVYIESVIATVVLVQLHNNHSYIIFLCHFQSFHINRIPIDQTNKLMTILYFLSLFFFEKKNITYTHMDFDGTNSFYFSINLFFFLICPSLHLMHLMLNSSSMIMMMIKSSQFHYYYCVNQSNWKMDGKMKWNKIALHWKSKIVIIRLCVCVLFFFGYRKIHLHTIHMNIFIHLIYSHSICLNVLNISYWIKCFFPLASSVQLVNKPLVWVREMKRVQSFFVVSIPEFWSNYIFILSNQ